MTAIPTSPDHAQANHSPLQMLRDNVHGAALITFLKIRHSSFVRALRPFAVHLERELFPSLRERREKWLLIRVWSSGPHVYLRMANPSSDEVFEQTELIAEQLRRIDIEQVRLDTRLESEQIIEALLLLFHAMAIAPDVSPIERPRSGWSRKSIYSSMTGQEGLRRICCLMRFHHPTAVFEVEYAYCDLFFTQLVRRYLQAQSYLGDHRTLLALAPKAAALIALLFIFSFVLTYASLTAALIAFGVLGIICAITLGLSIYALGSIHYAREHYDQLAEEYYRQITGLARFPEANPNLVIEFDPRGGVLYQNSALRAFLAEASTDCLTCILPPEYTSWIQTALSQVDKPYEIEVTLRGRMFRFSFSPFPNVQSVIAVGMDITYLKRIESELQGLNRKLGKRVEQRTQELRETQDATVFSLAALTETRDKETGKHLERTRRYVKVLAERLQNDVKFRDRLTPEVVEQLYKSTPLHDIGKVGVSDQVLRKPGALSEKEFEEMKRHTILGGDTLRSAEERLGFDTFLSVARDIAYYHHERWDGQGYPYGLEGEAIPLCARLMALADVYDALRTRRAYKEPYPHEKAVEIIREGRGTHFDPEVVDAFMDAERKFAEVAENLQEPQPVGHD